MTGADDHQPSRIRTGRYEPGTRVHVLAPDAAGCWVVRTRHTTHLFDLDAAAYARLPGPGRRAIDHDRTWLRLLRFGLRPSVGTSFLIFVDHPDPVVAAYWELWRASSTVMSIEACTRQHLEHLRVAGSPGAGT